MTQQKYINVPYVKLAGATNLTVNQAAYHLFRGIRSPELDNLMLNITLLGQKQVVFPVFLAIIGVLTYLKKYREAFHAGLLGVLAGGSIVVFKHLFQSVRPWGITNSPETFSMPSGHTVMAIALYFGLAFLIANSLKANYKRKLVYVIAFIITVAISTSRMYLGAHWFTDVMSSWLLSSAIICFVIISYERAKVTHINPLQIFLASLISLVISFGIYHHLYFSKLQTNYTALDWPVLSINMNNWWDNESEIPEARSSLFGFPSQPINIQWVGNLDDIKNTLSEEGWMKPPARDWISSIHRLADVKSTQFLPMISPQYQDKKPALILTKNVPGIKSLLIIRMWAANRIVADGNQPLWVGIIGIVPRTYSWVYKKHSTNLELTPDLIFTADSKNKWNYKVVTVTNKQSKPQLILLIRPNQ